MEILDKKVPLFRQKHFRVCNVFRCGLLAYYFFELSIWLIGIVNPETIISDLKVRVFRTINIFVKNQNLCQKWKFLLKNRKFGRKLKF